jgi:hypothetical protein
MRGVDLSVFRFDWDETWAGFLMNARGRVYGRVFGRDATSPMSHRSIDGLAAALRGALELHREEAGRDPDPEPPPAWRRIDDVPATRKWRKAGDCIHCHNVREDLRRQEIDDAAWSREKLWTFPPPENAGLGLDLREPARLASVASGSGAERAGLRAGDVLRRIGGLRVLSWGDVFLALDRIPAPGEAAVEVLRDGAPATATLRLGADWRRSDLSWRASLESAPPDPGLHVRALDDDERRSLGIDGPALRVTSVARGGAAERASLAKNDVLLGLPPADEPRFQAWIRTEHAPGGRVSLRVLRAGRPFDAALELPK